MRKQNKTDRHDILARLCSDYVIECFCTALSTADAAADATAADAAADATAADAADADADATADAAPDAGDAPTDATAVYDPLSSTATTQHWAHRCTNEHAGSPYGSPSWSDPRAACQTQTGP